jgi:hypothetical protein
MLMQRRHSIFSLPGRFADPAEAEYIEACKPASQSKEEEKSAPPPLPWKSIFTSVPFLTLCFAHTANNTGWSVHLSSSR